MDLAQFLALDAEARAAHLAGLEPEALAALTDALAAHFADLDGQPATADVIAQQEVVVAATLAARAENDTRLTAEAEAETARQTLREQMAAPTVEEPETGDDQREGGNPPHSEPAEPSLPEVEQPEKEKALAASAPAVARKPSLSAMSKRAPMQTTPRVPATTQAAFVVAEQVPGYRGGSSAKWDEVGKMAVAKLAGVEEFDVSGKFPIVQMDWSHAFGADRRLSSQFAAEQNSSLVAAVTNRDAMTAAARDYLATNPSDAEALTAAGGGFCAPFPIDYDVPTQGSTSRPVRDALARFGADRGGVSFTTPPVLNSNPATNGVSTWTATDDAAVTLNGATGVYSAPKTKPIVEYACLPNTTEQVYGIVHRQSFSNFTARFSPEQVAAYMQLGMVNHARFAEQALLQALWERVSFRVTTAKVLGTARDFFRLLDSVLPQARGRERLGQNFPMRCLAPDYLMDNLRADFVAQMGAYDKPGEAFALAEATVRAWAAVRNVNLTWYLDDRNGGTGSYNRTQPTLAADGTGTAVLLDHADTIEWYLYPEGTFQFLDGGTLDLGIVRDTRTNAVNRFETFAETFEGVAKRGTYGYALQSPFEPTGAAAGLVATGALDL